MMPTPLRSFVTVTDPLNHVHNISKEQSRPQLLNFIQYMYVYMCVKMLYCYMYVCMHIMWDQCQMICHETRKVRRSIMKEWIHINFITCCLIMALCLYKQV